MKDISKYIEKKWGRGEHGWPRRIGVFGDDGKTPYKRDGSFGICEDEEATLEAASHYCMCKGMPADTPPGVDPLEVWRLRKVNTPPEEIGAYFGYSEEEWEVIVGKYPMIQFLQNRGDVAYRTMIREGQYQLGRNLNEGMLTKLGEHVLKQKFTKEKENSTNVQVNVGAVSDLQAQIGRSYKDIRAAASQGNDPDSVQGGQILLNGGDTPSNEMDTECD